MQFIKLTPGRQVLPERKVHQHFRKRLHDAVDGLHVRGDLPRDFRVEAAEAGVESDRGDGLETEPVARELESI
jgi:hypothetical protein